MDYPWRPVMRNTLKALTAARGTSILLILPRGTMTVLASVGLGWERDLA
jgi:hypothetical protein